MNAIETVKIIKKKDMGMKRMRAEPLVISDVSGSCALQAVT